MRVNASIRTVSALIVVHVIMSVGKGVPVRTVPSGVRLVNVKRKIQTIISLAKTI